MIDDTNPVQSDEGQDQQPELDSEPAVGPVTLPGRVRGGLRAMALAGFVAGGMLGLTAVAPPITTISSVVH